MIDERRAYTRLGQRARAKERASRARAHTIRISRAQLPCLVAQQLSVRSQWRLAPGPPAALHITQYHMSPDRGCPEVLKKLSLGAGVKNQLQCINVLEMAFRRVALGGPRWARSLYNPTDPWRPPRSLAARWLPAASISRVPEPGQPRLARAP